MYIWKKSAIGVSFSLFPLRHIDFNKLTQSMNVIKHIYRCRQHDLQRRILNTEIRHTTHTCTLSIEYLLMHRFLLWLHKHTCQKKTWTLVTSISCPLLPTLVTEIKFCKDKVQCWFFSLTNWTCSILISLWTAPHSSLSCLLNAATHLSINVASSIQQLSPWGISCTVSEPKRLLDCYARSAHFCSTYSMASIWEGIF